MNLFRDQKVKGQDHRVTKCKGIAASTRYVCIYMQREDIGTATLNSHAVVSWLSLYTPPIDSMQVWGITIFLILACMFLSTFDDILAVTMCHQCMILLNQFI